jgi:hypothetical protein
MACPNKNSDIYISMVEILGENNALSYFNKYEDYIDTHPLYEKYIKNFGFKEGIEQLFNKLVTDENVATDEVTSDNIKPKYIFKTEQEAALEVENKNIATGTIIEIDGKSFKVNNSPNEDISFTQMEELAENIEPIKTKPTKTNYKLTEDLSVGNTFNPHDLKQIINVGAGFLYQIAKRKHKPDKGNLVKAINYYMAKEAFIPMFTKFLTALENEENFFKLIEKEYNKKYNINYIRNTENEKNDEDEFTGEIAVKDFNDKANEFKSHEKENAKLKVLINSISDVEMNAKLDILPYFFNFNEISGTLIEHLRADTLEDFLLKLKTLSENTKSLQNVPNYENLNIAVNKNEELQILLFNYVQKKATNTNLILTNYYNDKISNVRLINELKNTKHSIKNKTKIMNEFTSLYQSGIFTEEKLENIKKDLVTVAEKVKNMSDAAMFEENIDKINALNAKDNILKELIGLFNTIGIDLNKLQNYKKINNLNAAKFNDDLLYSFNKFIDFLENFTRNDNSVNTEKEKTLFAIIERYATEMDSVNFKKGELMYLNNEQNMVSAYKSLTELQDFVDILKNPERLKEFILERLQEDRIKYSNWIHSNSLITPIKNEKGDIIDVTISEEYAITMDLFINTGSKEDSSFGILPTGDIHNSVEILHTLLKYEQHKKTAKTNIALMHRNTPSEGVNYSMVLPLTRLGDSFFTEFESLKNSVNTLLNHKNFEITEEVNDVINISWQDKNDISHSYRIKNNPELENILNSTDINALIDFLMRAASPFTNQGKSSQGHAIFNSFLKMFFQDIASIEQNEKRLKSFWESNVTEQDVDLQLYYDYVLDNNGKKIRGNYAKINTFPFLEDVFKKLDLKIEDLKIEDFQKDNKATELLQVVKTEMLRFLHDKVNTVNSIINKNEIVQKVTDKKGKGIFTDAAYVKNTALELYFNYFINQNELSNFVSGKIGEHKNYTDFTKRNKSPQSLGTHYARFSKNDSFYTIVLNDVVTVNKLLADSKIELTDAQSIITLSGYKDKLLRKGIPENQINEKINALKNEEASKGKFTQLKNFYSSYEFDSKLKRPVKRQIKNSEVILDSRNVTGELKQFLEYIENLEEELGKPIQINFLTAEKTGAVNILNPFDENGHINLTDEIKLAIRKGLQPTYYKHLKEQVTITPEGNAPSVNSASQIERVILTNLKDKTLKKEYIELNSALLSQREAAFAEKFYTKENFVDSKKFNDFLKEHIDKQDNLSNIKYGLTLDANGHTKLPMYFPLLDNAAQQAITSNIRKNLLKGKRPGGHLYQVANVFSFNKTKVAALNEINVYSINWLKKEHSLDIKQDEKGNYYYEILIHPFYKNFITNLENVDASLLEMIGFRIPTEGKFSIGKMKIVGFLPDNMSTAIVLPNEWIDFTGSDNDGDSVYFYYHNQKNGKKIAYSTKPSELKERYIAKQKEKLNAQIEELFQEKKENYDAIIETIKENFSFLKNKKDVIQALKEYKQEINTEILQNKYNENDEAFEKKLTIAKKEVFDNLNTFFENSQFLEEEFNITLEELLDVTPENLEKFNKLSLTEQNTKAAIQNRILDIQMEIISSLETFEEIKNKSNFENIENAKKEIDKIQKVEKQGAHPFDMYEQLELESILSDGSKLKGIFVNLANVGQIANIAGGFKLNHHTLRIRLTDEQIAAFPNLKELYGKNFNSETKILTLNTLGTLPNGSFTLPTGKLLSALNSEPTANALDITKNPMLKGINTETAKHFAAFTLLGYWDFDFASKLFAQRSIQSFIEKSKIEKTFYKKNENVFNQLIRTYDATISALKGEKSKEKNIKDILDKYQNVNLAEVPDVDMLTENLEMSNDIAKAPKELKIAYLENQIFFLNYFRNEVLPIGNTLNTLSTAINIDTKGIKGDFAHAFKTIKNYENIHIKDRESVYEISALNSPSTSIQEVSPYLKALFQTAYAKPYYTFTDEIFTTDSALVLTPILNITTDEKSIKEYRKHVKKVAIAGINPENPNYFNRLDNDVASRKILLGLYNKEGVTKHTAFFDINQSFETDLDKQKALTLWQSLSTANKLEIVQLEYKKQAVKYLQQNVVLDALSYNATIKKPYEVISFNTEVVNDDFITDYRKLLNSDNIFIQQFAIDLIGYTYLTTAFNFGNNISKIIPFELFKENNFLYENFELEDSFDRNAFFNNQHEIVLNFLRTQKYNDKLVPNLNKYVAIKVINGEKVTLQESGLNRSNLVVKIKVKNTYLLYQTMFLEDIINVIDKNTGETVPKQLDIVDFIPITALEKYENDETSYNNVNNSTPHGHYHVNANNEITNEEANYAEVVSDENIQYTDVLSDETENQVTNFFNKHVFGEVFAAKFNVALSLFNKNLDLDILRKNNIPFISNYLYEAPLRTESLEEPELRFGIYRLTTGTEAKKTLKAFFEYNKKQKIRNKKGDIIEKTSDIDDINMLKKLHKYLLEKFDDPSLYENLNYVDRWGYGEKNSTDIKRVNEQLLAIITFNIKKISHYHSFYNTEKNGLFNINAETLKDLDNVAEISEFINDVNNLIKSLKILTDLNTLNFGELLKNKPDLKLTDYENYLNEEQLLTNKILYEIGSLGNFTEELSTIVNKVTTKFAVTLMDMGTTNPKLLKLKNTNIQEYYKTLEYHAYNITTTSAQANQLNSAFESMDVFTSNVLNFINNNLNTSFETTNILKDFKNVSKTVNLKDPKLFQTVNGQKVLFWDLDYINKKYPKFFEFLMDKINRAAEINPDGHIAKGGIPVLDTVKDNIKSVGEFLQKKAFHFYDTISVNTDNVAVDVFGTRHKKLGLTTDNVVKPYNIFKIPPYSPKKDGSLEEYAENILINIKNNYGYIFNDLKELRLYNKLAEQANSKIKDNYLQNVNTDLELVFPIFLKELVEVETKIRTLPLAKFFRSHLVKVAESESDTVGIRQQNLTTATEVVVSTARKVGNFITWNKFKAVEKDSNRGHQIINQIDYLLDNIYYGGVNKSGKTVTKWGRSLRNYSAVLGMGINVKAAASNIALGRFKNFFKTVNGDIIDVKSLAFAEKFYYDPTVIGSYFTDLANIDGTATSLQSGLIKYFDILKRTHETEGKVLNTTNKTKAIINQNVSFAFLNNAGEHGLQNKLLFAMLKSHKVIDGKIYSLREYMQKQVETEVNETENVSLEKHTMEEALVKTKEKNKERKAKGKNIKTETSAAKAKFDKYKSVLDHISLNKEGFLEFDNLSKEELNKFQNRVLKLNHEIHGVYNKEDLGRFAQTELGRMLLMFRKWIKPTLDFLIGKSLFLKSSDFYYDEVKGKTETGAVQEFMKFIFTNPTAEARITYEQLNENDRKVVNFIRLVSLEFFSNLKDIRSNTNAKLTTEQISKISELAVWLSTYLAMKFTAKAYYRYLRETDDGEDWWGYALASFLFRTVAELGFFFNPFKEGEKLLQSSAAGVTTGKSIYEFLEAAVKDSYDAIFKDGVTVISKGKNKNKTETRAKAEKLIPFWSQALRLQNIIDDTKTSNPKPK